MRVRSTWKSALVNAATVVVSVVLACVVGAVVMFRFVIPYLSPTLRANLADLPDIVGQTSKRDDLPHDYIAILGDSYAQGLGDWLIAAEARGASQFHSAHVLHQLTGRDVITLGRWGYGSAQEMVLKPSRVYFDRTCFLFPKVESPERILVYFYEGNDAIDNYRWVEMRVPEALSGNSPHEIDRYLHDRYGAVEWWRCPEYFTKTLQSMVGFITSGWHRSWAAPAAPAIPAAAPIANRVLISNVAQSVPSALTAPSIDLDERSVELAMIVFTRSLAWLLEHFPDTKVSIIYLPSPAAVYRYADPVITTKEGTATRSRPTADVYAASQSLCERIRSLSMAQGARFIDTRRAIRTAASARLLHGPIDWQHFNEAGYRILGETLAGSIDETSSTECFDGHK